MRGFTPTRSARGDRRSRSSSGPGCCTGATGSRCYRRTTIILYGIGGGARARGRRPRRQPRRAGCRSSLPIGGLAAAGGLFVLAGATPAALGLLADMSERFPADRGAIMGLYSVFLALGQIVGSLIGGVAADWHGIDGLLVATLVLCSASRSSRCRGCAAGAPARRWSTRSWRRTPDPDRGRPTDATARPASARSSRCRSCAARTARSSRRITSRPRPGSRSCAPGGHAVDAAIATNAVLGVVLPSGCGLGGDAFWLIWDEAAGRQTALNGSGSGAGRGRRRRAPRRRASPRSPTAGRSSITVPGAVRSWGDAHARHRPAARAARSWRRRSSWHGTGSRRGTGSSRAVEATLPAVVDALGAGSGSSRSTGRTAEPGDPASGFACRPWRRRSSGWPTVGFDDFYDGELGERQARGLGGRRLRRSRPPTSAAHTSTWTRADRDRLPRRPGHDPPAEQLRASSPSSC